MNQAMSALDAAKEIARIGETAGVSKEVMGLLEAQASWLAERISALEKEKAALTEENTALLREDRILKVEIESLKKDAAALRTNELDDYCTKLLQAVAHSKNITDHELRLHFGLTKAKGDFLLDQLYKRKFISSPGGNMRGSFLSATEQGRNYLARIGLL
jgi:hypothetical protein